jgi:molybdopterin/thiamine biosynthesis adenylyltransferase/rhodanese-related sulfurtransferase
MTTLNDQEFLRYSRHLLIPEVGLDGQEKLKASSALIIGTGGLGSPISLYLAAAGIGRIGIVDYDVVDSSNLQRQIIHSEETLGKLKVDSARARMLGLNPFIQVDAYNEPFTAENAMKIATGYDIIIDGTDNFPTRYLSNDVAAFLGIPNIYGSIYQFDGQASVFHAKEGPCYRCLFPAPPPPHLVPSCAEGGVLGVLPGTVGSIQATEAIKMLLGIGSSLLGRLLLYNALDMTFDYVNLKKNPKCPVCGENPTITELIDYEEFCGVPGHHADEWPDEFDISALELKELVDKRDDFLILDVREPHELQISAIAGAKNIPFGELASRLSELNTAQEIVLICRTGNRTLHALEMLLGAGFRKLKNLENGINEWARDVDTSLPVY